MKEVIFEKQGADPTLSETEKPSPASDQILVKSLYTAMNPVDGFVAATGLFVDRWPAGLGADASGVMVEVGDVAEKQYGFKKGDYVCGCTRIGNRQYSTAREFFLMDVHDARRCWTVQVTMRRPSNLNAAEAATIGAAAQTASFGIFAGCQIPEPTDGKAVATGDTWMLILGGAGSVGRTAVQLAKASGCKVIASCSEKSSADVKGCGANAVFDYHLPLEKQIGAVKSALGGASLTKIFDCTSADDPELAKALFRETKDSPKLFATTNDWSVVGVESGFEGGKTYPIHLGMIGRPEGKELNALIERWDQFLLKLYENGALKPMEQDFVGDGGL